MRYRRSPWRPLRNVVVWLAGTYITRSLLYGFTLAWSSPALQVSNSPGSGEYIVAPLTWTIVTLARQAYTIATMAMVLLAIALPLAFAYSFLRWDARWDAERYHDAW